jgi:ClpP class serine protease
MKTLRLYATLTTLVVAMVAAAVQVVRIHKSEARKRDDLEIWKQNQIAVIRRAGDIMKNRIDLGYYDDYDDTDVLVRLATDMEFYKIAIQEEA